LRNTLVKVGVSRRFTKGSYSAVVVVDLDKALKGFGRIATAIKEAVWR